MIAFALILSCSMLFSCEEADEERLRDQAEKAATEMCRCLETKSKSKCETELQKKYKNDISQEFVDLFNEVETCGITLSLTYTKHSNNTPIVLIKK